MFIPLWLVILCLAAGAVCAATLATALRLAISFARHLLRDIPANTALPVEFLPAYIRTYWKYLGVAKGGAPMRVAIYGAGKHTQWLCENAAAADFPGPTIVALVDDNNACATYWGLYPIKLEDLDIAGLDAVIISSDIHNQELRRKCENLFKGKIQVIDFYEGIPHLYFPKRGWLAEPQGNGRQ